MKHVNVVLIVLLVIMAVISATSLSRLRRSDAALRARTDSADVRTSHLVAELEAAEASERRLADSVAKLQSSRAILVARAGAERLKSDSLLKFAMHIDSVAVPKPLVRALVASLHSEMVVMDSVIKLLYVENSHLFAMYASADSGRAALFNALDEQRSLTRQWRAVAKPPLFSLRRLKVGPGCAAGIGGMACGIAVTYGF